MYIVARWLSCLHCLHCSLTARWSWVRFPHGALLALGGRSSQAFLCGVCMFSPCSQGVPSNKNPNRKTCKKEQFTLLSVSDRGGRFTWSPGAEKLPTAPGGSWGKDSLGWGNAEVKFTAIVDITRLYTNENHLGTPYSSQLSWKYK